MDDEEIEAFLQRLFDLGLFCLGLLFIFSLLVLNGCSSVTTPINSPKNNPDSVFKKELSVKVNGKWIDGVGVIPKADEYTFIIQSKVDVDLFSVTSCHRDFSTQDAIDVNWVHPKRSYVYVYKPISGIEDVGSCLIRIAAFNKDKGASSFATFDFETDAETLPATINCNGEKTSSNGVSVCQSREGLFQSIEFISPVDCIFDGDKAQVSPDGMKIEWQMSKGEKIWACREKAAPNRIHRHTNFGFNDYIIEVK